MTCRLAALVTLALSYSLPRVTLSASPLYSATATSDITTASWSQESHSDTSSLMMVTITSETTTENSTALSFHATTAYPTGAPGSTTMESVTDSNETATTSTFDGATDSNYTTSSFITEIVTVANATTISFQTETSSDSNETTITSAYDTATYLNYTTETVTDASDPTLYLENVTESNYTTDIAFNLTSPSPTTTIKPPSTTTGTTTTTTPDPVRCGSNNIVPPQGVDSTLTLLASRNVSYKCNPGFVETGKGASAIVCTGGLWVDASGQPGEVKQGLVCELAPTKEPEKGMQCEL